MKDGAPMDEGAPVPGAAPPRERALRDPAALWQDDSREFVIGCDANGVVAALDARAEKLGVSRGASFFSLAAPGAEEKARSIVERGRREPLRDSEVPLLFAGRIVTVSFRTKPDGDGGVSLLGCTLPNENAGALEQVQASMAEVVELNREVSRQKRDIEQQKRELETAYRDLGESNRAVVTLHGELEERAVSLQRAADVKSRVVANVSHEFRTPLHTILGLSGILLDDADGPLSDEQRKQVQYIRTSAEELQQLVNDMLDLSKVESGKPALRLEAFSAWHLLSALRGQMRPLIETDPRVELVVAEPEQDFELETDHGKIAQILRNLVSNALKFTEQGEVRVSARREGDSVSFSVSDTGIGIDEADFERVFEEFGQVDNEIQRRVKGTGLGLPLSRRLAELLHGRLALESTLGKGSTFTLTLPLVHPEASELTSLKARPLDPSKAPILVVEDDRKTIFVYEKYLSMAGFQVIPARTVDDARRSMAQIRPAAIVLDVMLEGETTWEFLADLKRNPETSEVPVLVVTVTSKPQKARALGADEFWLKPVNPDRLISKLKALTRPGIQTKVLVIDDDERARYLIKKLLTGTPYALSEAATGPEGVRLARETSPQVIFLDFLLRDMTAFDVLDELKADPRTRAIPVIVVTSHMLDAGERDRLAADTEAILSKENLSRELAINRIRDALAKAGVTPRHGS
ncbi:MAG TPA: response regulator [Polyangiaceae bacterium]|nr:response regulator [Polyangiaceae bacterium]